MSETSKERIARLQALGDTKPEDCPADNPELRDDQKLVGWDRKCEHCKWFCGEDEAGMPVCNNVDCKAFDARGWVGCPLPKTKRRRQLELTIIIGVMILALVAAMLFLA